jgi:hypothetical protein
MGQLGLIETMDEISVGPLIGVVRPWYHVASIREEVSLEGNTFHRRKLL